MKKIFLDCGSNIGQAMTQFAKTNSIDHTWEVHMFEPNPKCYCSTRRMNSTHGILLHL